MARLTFTENDLRDLEAILIREKATAVAELRTTERLWGAYGDKRDAIGTRMGQASQRYGTAMRLLARLRELQERT